MTVLRIVGLWLSTSWRATRAMTAGMCACVLVTAILPAIALLGISRAVDAYASHAPVWPGIWLAAAAVLMAAVASEATWPIADTVEDLVSRYVHDDLLRLTAEIPSIAHHEDPALAARLGLIEDDVQALIGGPQLLGTLGSVASTVTVVGLLGSVHPLLCLLLGVALLPAMVEVRAARRQGQVQIENEPYRTLTQRCVDVLTSPRQGVEVRCFGLSGPLLAACDHAMRRHARPRIALHRRFAVYSGGGWLIFGTAYALAVWWILLRLQDGRATVGDVSLLLLIGAQVISAGEAITANVRMVADHMQTFGRYQWLREYAARRRWHDSDAAPPEVLCDGIRLRGVSFAYPARPAGAGRQEVLRDIDLHLPAGSTVAFVGANGTGKSTLVKLLARLYDPTQGEILLDGTPLHTIDPVLWRARISAGFQDYATFEFLAADSIGVGELARRTDRRHLHSAITSGQAQPVVASLPAGLDTQLGTAFEGGVGLSGGQWQRLALARAFMRDRPLLMLLDEPTAALDPEAEHALYDQYAATAKELATTTGAITVLVSHRFSTVRMADLIVVMEDGRITELGSHDSLVQAGGHYGELFELQARAYRR